MPEASAGGGGGTGNASRSPWATFQHRIGYEVPRHLKRSAALRRAVRGVRYRRLGSR